MPQGYELRTSEAGTVLQGDGFADGDVMIYDVATGLWFPGTVSGAAFYQTIEQGDGTPLPQESVLRIHNATMTDDPGVATDLVLHYQTVQEAGTPLTQRGALDFSSDFSVTDDAGGDRTIIAFSASSRGQIIEPTTAALSALDATSFLDGTSAQVEGFDYFMLNLVPPAGSTADGVNLLTVTGHGGAFWVRQYANPATNQYFSVLHVNQGTGDDSARDPQNAGTPLKTLQEAFRRIKQLGLIQQNILITYAATTIDESIDVDLTGIVVASFATTITIQGTTAVAASQVLTTFTAPVPTTNTRGNLLFPAAGFTRNNFLTDAATGAAGWANASAGNNSSVGHFFALDGTQTDPANGDTIEHRTFSSGIGNVNARLPPGFFLNIQRCKVSGKQESICESAFAVTYTECFVTLGRNGYGPATYINCWFDGGIQSGGGPTTNSADDCIFNSCTIANAAQLDGCHNVIFAGSTVFSGAAALLSLLDSTVTCQVAGALADLSIWGLSSIDSAIEVARSTLSLGFTTVFGNLTGGVNNSFRVDTCGWITVQSANLPKITGANAPWRCSPGRKGLFTDLPVFCPDVPSGFVFEDTRSGTEGFNFETTGLVANLPPTQPFPTQPAAGLYRVTAYLSLIGTGTTGVINAVVTWTDKTNQAQSATLCTVPNIAASTPGVQGDVVVEIFGSAPLTYSTTGIVTPGALTYDAHFVIEKISSG
jgi:hypothetical protein